jgi:hypothetical protein
MTFGQWFRAQFGKRPSPRTVLQLEGVVDGVRWQLAKAEEVLRKTRKWENDREAALYAWQARGK